MKFLFLAAGAVFSLMFSGLQAQAGTAAPATQNLRDNATGVTFPGSITEKVNGKEETLQATGVATRKKFFVKVYSVASYVQNAASLNKGNAFEKILEPGSLKQLNIKWVRNAEVAKIKEGYDETFKKVFPNPSPEIKSLQQKYLSFFTDVKNGDEQVIRWLPDNTVEVLLNGEKKGSVQSEEFAKGIWNIWFGKNAVVNRNELISSLK